MWRFSSTEFIDERRRMLSGFQLDAANKSRLIMGQERVRSINK